MRILRALVLMAWGAGLAVACGSAHLSAPPKPPRGHGLIHTGDAPPPLEVGEHLVANAKVLGVSIGTLHMELTQSCDPDRPLQWTVESKLGTSGIARLFNKTRGSHTTTLDPRTLVPTFSQTVVAKGDEWRRYRVTFARNRYHFVYENSDGHKETGDGGTPEGDPVYDTQSAYLLLRSWNPKPGEKSYYYIVLGRHLWRADVRFVGSVHLKPSGTSTETLHIAGKAHRVDLEPGEEYEPRSFALWLTADSRRIPLRVEGDGALGTIHFDLEQRTIEAPCTFSSIRDLEDWKDAPENEQRKSPSTEPPPDPPPATPEDVRSPNEAPSTKPPNDAPTESPSDAPTEPPSDTRTEPPNELPLAPTP